MNMEDLKEFRYLVKSNSYIIDLTQVDFITWKENDKVAETYWTKLHIGSKEARYVCADITELQELIRAWTKLQGKVIEVSKEELLEEW
tara:strand:+ start:3637 stop:3900 length:264 start_codon:yes stop_codon:yes gene_type:complete